MDFNGSKNAIIHELGAIRATQSIIIQTQQEQGRELRWHRLMIDRLEQRKPAAQPFYQTDKFWWAVVGVGASLAGMPELAKLFLPH